jgi:hypothetical protein
MQNYVATRSFKTNRYTFETGHPIPARLNTPHGRKFLQQTYGADVILEVDTAAPDKLLALFSKDGVNAQEYVRLKQLTEEQAKTLRDQGREIERLKKQVQRLTAT